MKMPHFITQKKLFSILALALSIFISPKVFSQAAPFCPSINSQFGTGPTTVICNGSCANLTASVVPVNLTTSYSVAATPYAPFSFTAGSSILANQDDIWSNVLNIGFPFCYYGNTFNQCVVGSNGQLTFNLASAGGIDNWAITTAIPSTIDMPGNTICAAFRDIDPTSSGNIYFATYGTAPCRSFVVSWSNVPMFDNPGPCGTTANSTFQLVLHETTNYIDVFIQNSSACTAWNSGYGIIGIQNGAASAATVPPARNFPGAWTAINEAWRFAPTGAPTFTVNWAGPSGPAGTGLTANVCPSATTQYTATMQVSACAGALSSYTSAVTVSVVPGPTLAVTSASVCAGVNGTLTASGATTYTWLTGGTTGPSASYAPLATTVYTVQGSTGSTCISQGTGTIFINPTPSPNIVSNSPVCVGAPINFTGSGGTSYLWVGPNSFNSSSATPNIPVSAMANNGNYTLTVGNAQGCFSTVIAPVVVNPKPMVGATGSSVCVNQTINLSANGGTGYAWTGPGGFTSNQQNPSIAGATSAMTGLYNVTVTDANGCVSTGSANVIVNPPPQPTASNNSPVCINGNLSMSATGGVTYSWVGPNGFSSNSQSTVLTANSLNFSGNYTVTVGDAIGCSTQTVIAATVNPLPSVFIASGLNHGCAPLCVNFTASSSSGISDVTWLTGDGGTQNGISINNCFMAGGDYDIKAIVTDINGCVNNAITSVNAYPIPVADFNYAPIEPVDEELIQFTDASYNANITSWNWYFMATAEATATEQNPAYTYPTFGTYAIALIVKSDKGCTDTTMKSIVVMEDVAVYVPDAFSPNGDGLNDVFHPKGHGIKEYQIEVYDRWGETLFHASEMQNGWDGKFKNKQIAPEGTYVWRIRYIDVYGKSKELTGHVTLIK